MTMPSGKGSRTTGNSGKYLFLIVGLLLLAFGGGSMAVLLPGAVAESRLAARSIPTVGTVVETRLARVERTKRKVRWVWQKEGLVEYTAGDRSQRQWLVLIESSDLAWVQVGGIGETLPLWYDPATDAVTMEAPHPGRSWLEVAGMALWALVGLVCLALQVHLLKQSRREEREGRERRRGAEPPSGLGK
jgi:hypothetical protein